MKFFKPTLLLLILTIGAAFKKPTGLPSADEIVKNVNTRDEGKHLVQLFSMELIDKGGKTQTRETKAYRKDFADQRKTVVVYLSPTTVKGTAFMSFDYSSNKEDDQWLYLPALRKTRRISASNRGDYFLGTDFTYEDIKLGTKLSTADYKRITLKEEEVDGHKCYLIESVPVNDKIGKELGYQKVHLWIDAGIWIVRKAQYWDVAGNLLKTTLALDIKKVQGIWTIHKMEAVNHKTNHKTNLKFSGADYKSEVADDLFSEESLERGVN